jgi:hypothetical protein
VDSSHCALYIEAMYNFNGISLSQKDRTNSEKTGAKADLIAKLQQYCEVVGKRDDQSQSYASEYAINFLASLVKLLKSGVDIFVNTAEQKEAEDAVTHAVGPELIAFMDHISKDKDRVSCPLAFEERLCLDGVARECMFHHLIKAYHIDFKGFPDFIEDVKSATAIKRAVSEVCIPPASPGIFAVMSVVNPFPTEE